MLRFTKAVAVLCLLAGTLSCGGCSTRVTMARGELALLWEEGGEARISRDATYDFGTVRFAEERTLTVRVTNLGRGTLTLGALEPLSGDEVAVGEATEDAPFVVGYAPSVLGPAEVVEYQLTFRPVAALEKVRSYEALLQLTAANAPPGEETAQLVIRGRALSGECSLPEALDFGPLPVGDALTRTLRLWNTSPVDAVATVSPVTTASQDHAAFTFGTNRFPGDLPLPSGSSEDVPLIFRPAEPRPYQAAVRVRTSQDCPEVEVGLTGRGVLSRVVWEPNPLDFGPAQPGARVVRALRFRNLDAQEVKLKGLRTQGTDFHVEGGVSDLVVPPLGSATLDLAFIPTVLGPREGGLLFDTDLPTQPQGAAQLVGYGGAPDILVKPAPLLNFGKVPYFASASPQASQTRRITVMNVGTRPTPPDPKGNLHLGRQGLAPYFEVQPVAPTLDTQEISVSLAGPYDDALGLEAVAGKNVIDLLIEVTPRSLGSKQWVVTVFSDDPDSPAVKVTVSADAVSLPPCRYSVSPANLNFGLVPPLQQRELELTIQNDGTTAGELCLVSADLAQGTDPVFSLRDGPKPSEELQPGQTLKVGIVATAPAAATSLTQAAGTLVVRGSSPSQPQVSVPLAAAVGPSCLVVTPEEEHFGVVKRSCGSSARTFMVYNSCSGSVTLTGLTLQNAAGQAAGGPNCPGTLPCPEFKLVNAPAVPSAGLQVVSGTPVSFRVRYVPIDVGADLGTVALSGTRGGQAFLYLVTLKGRGDDVGLNTDRFTAGTGQADVLLVIDNSGSMANEQRALADNFSAFFKYATTAQIDYHVAVTTTDAIGGKGRLVFGPSHPEKVLTPVTPDVENKFKAKVRVGTSGSKTEQPFEAASLALTAPLIYASNAGFLRPDAPLAIVVVTDEQEQSTWSVPHYLGNFVNVKGSKRRGLMTFNAVARFGPYPLPAGCHALQDDGRLSSMVSQTLGVKEDICTSNWATSLERIGNGAFARRSHFFLNGTPNLVAQPLEVRVNGVSVPPQDPQGAVVWTFDSGANAVRFFPPSEPAPGAIVEIVYQGACLPP